MRERETIKKNNIYMCVTIIFVAVILVYIYKLWDKDIINIPLACRDDGVWELVSQKIISEGSKMNYVTDRLGAPFGYDTKDFMNAAYLSKLWMNAWALFTDNYVLSYNLGYLSAYMLLAIISFWVLIKLEIQPEVCFVSSILYTFLPYHLLRGQIHLSLSFYIMVPIAVFYFLKLMGNKDEKTTRKSLVAWIVSMVFIGMSGVYYAFFSCFFLCVVILYNLINKVSIKRFFCCICSIILICGGMIFALLPNILYLCENGINKSAVVRQSSEVPLYALRLTQLVLPVTDHRLAFLAKVKDIYNQMIVVTESDWASLGIWLTIGFGVIILNIFRISKKNENSFLFSELSVLTLCGLLYASVGSFIEIQAMAISVIRCANRISVFIAFFACISFGIVVQKLLRKAYRSNQIIFNGILIIILCVGIYDQTPGIKAECYETFYDKSTVKFIEAIENENPDAMILQLPNVQFPENGVKNGMKDYSHFVGYLYSNSLKWSYGSMKGREGSIFLNNLCSLKTEDMVKQAAESGFEGIYIDRYGYIQSDVDELEKTLFQITGQLPIVSENGRYSYFSLKQYISRNNVRFKKGTISKNLIEVSNGENMYFQEEDVENRWYWCQNNSILKIVNYSNEEIDVQISFELESYAEQAGNIHITGNGFSKEVNVNQNKILFERTIHLYKGDNEICFDSNMANVDIESGQRQICFRILNCQIK